MFTQIVHLLPVLVRINRSERLEVGGVFLLSVAYDRDDTEKEKSETEKLGSATRICFAAYRAVLTWIIATRTTNAARVKNAWTFFSMPSQKARDKHTKRAVFQERRLLCHKLSSNASGHKKKNCSTYILTSLFVPSATAPPRRYANVKTFDDEFDSKNSTSKDLKSDPIKSDKRCRCGDGTQLICDSKPPRFVITISWFNLKDSQITRNVYTSISRVHTQRICREPEDVLASRSRKLHSPSMETLSM